MVPLSLCPDLKCTPVLREEASDRQGIFLSFFLLELSISEAFKRIIATWQI